jgi:HD superfamily phosphohydrolase
MYIKVYFHLINGSLEIILKHLLKLDYHLYQKIWLFNTNAKYLLHFLKGEYQLTWYLYRNDNVLNTYYAECNHTEIQSEDP